MIFKEILNIKKTSLHLANMLGLLKRKADSNLLGSGMETHNSERLLGEILNNALTRKTHLSLTANHSCLLVLILIISMTGNTVADGYRNPPPTAEGAAKSGVNSVFVDDASAISYNPANLTQQHGNSLVLSTTFIQTRAQIDQDSVARFWLDDLASESKDQQYILPNIYYSQSLDESGIVWGLGITTPYGQKISWETDDFFYEYVFGGGGRVYTADMKLINMNPTIAFKVTDTLSLGIGVDLVYSELDLNMFYDAYDANKVYRQYLLHANGDGWGVGANAGLTWQPTKRQRVTLTYRSRVDMDYKGETSVLHYDRQSRDTGVRSASDFRTTIKFPDIFGVGYGIQIRDNIRVETLLEWLSWQVNNDQPMKTGEIDLRYKPTKWHNTFTLGLGTEWNPLEHWTIRAGCAYLESPDSPNKTARFNSTLPDADCFTVSIGMGYSKGAHSVDAAYTSCQFLRHNYGRSEYSVESNRLNLTYSHSF